MNVMAVRTALFKEGNDLAAFIIRHIPKVKNGFVIVVSSKIAALAEGRTAGAHDKERLIKKESSWRKRILPKWWLTVRDGVAIVNAGIDDSNAEGKLVLLPKDCFKTAAALRAKLKRHYRIRNLGVILTDSRVAPLRAGVTGVALGYAGFKGVRDYRGTKDLFGRRLEVTQTNVADSLATAATLLMGEESERQPLAVIEDAPVEFAERVNRKETLISLKDDIYRDLFKRR
ncbi:MAG: coenzyme F420-0:L-glutamate ligase [Candidatus Kaiserbacteria bacterium]|nr:coenzyme F420-0:L-glutamate ligase [Candidatus Kaiserbacteria bacterium]